MGFGFWFCLTGERVARGRMNDCWSTLYCGAMPVPLLHANNDETPLTTLPRLDHSGGSGLEAHGKDWRWEAAFFAYFLCSSKESESRAGQGQSK